MRPHFVRLLCLPVLSLGFGCGEAETETGDREPEPIPEPSNDATGGAPSPPGTPSDTPSEGETPAFSYSQCEAGTRVGSFVVDVAPDFPDSPQFTSITGSVTDGVLPTAVPNVIAEAGDCRLLVTPRFECDPTCTALQTCGPSGCVDFPTQHSVGEVTITGLAVAMTMAPSGRNSYSNPPAAMLPHPGFEPEADLTLEAAGDEYSGFTLRGWGVHALAVPAATPEVRRDLPTEVRWTAPGVSGPAKLYLALNVDNHGSSAARIECLTEDDGELDIDAELTNQLLDRGLSGFPSLTLHRRTVDSTNIEPGCVEFVVGSQLVRDVEVEGLITCSTGDDCPDGQGCLPNLSCG